MTNHHSQSVLSQAVGRRGIEREREREGGRHREREREGGREGGEGERD